jgi:hypothetical protein
VGLKDSGGVEEITNLRRCYTRYDSERANMTFASFHDKVPEEIW